MTVENILRTYAAATHEERVAGKTWYDAARQLALNLIHTPDDHRPGVNIEQAAGVIAALSPLTPWERNKELAVRAIGDHAASGTLGNSVKAANRILNGEHPTTVLRADKVRNFYLSIMGSADAVCVDRHAWEVYAGRVYTNATRPAINRTRYREAADAYRSAATQTDVSATQLQAITWLTHRRLKGIK